MEMQERVQVLLTGWFTGDGMGSQTEGMETEEILALCPEGIDEVYTLEEARPLCGMSSEVSDLVVLLGLSIHENGGYDIDHAKATYRRYTLAAEGPSDQLKRILESGPTKGEHSLVLGRSIIHGIMKQSLSNAKWRQIVESESAITSTSTLAQMCALLISQAFALVVETGYEQSLDLLHDLVIWAQRAKLDKKIVETIQSACNRTPLPDSGPAKDHVLFTVRDVLCTLASAESCEDGVKQLVMRGRSARVSCALFASLCGGIYSMGELPERWTDEIFPSPALEAMIKKQTLFKRETIKMERLALTLSTKLPPSKD